MTAGLDTSQNFPEKYLNRIYDEKLFRMFLPKGIGGLETPLPEALKIIADCSQQNSDFGWAVAIGAGGGYFYPYMTSPVRDAVYSEMHSVIAGSGFPGGYAKPVKDGFQASGNWNYASGAYYATSFTATCILLDQEGKPTQESRAFVFKKEDVEVIPTWDAFGLSRTESHTIKVSEAFVPYENTFDVNKPPLIEGIPSQTFPFIQFAQASFCMVCKGIWKKCAESAQEVIESSASIWEPERSDRVLAKLKMADTRIDSLTEDFNAAIQESWANHCEDRELISSELQRIADLSISISTESSALALEMFTFLGMPVLLTNHPYNVAYRDLLVASQHSLLKWSYED